MKTVRTTPFEGQKPGTSGLRKKVICGMTINSKDEVLEFIKRLKPGAKDSDFTSVVPSMSSSTARTLKEWPKEAALGRSQGGSSGQMAAVGVGPGRISRLFVSESAR